MKIPYSSSTTCIWHPGMACHSCRSLRSCQAPPLSRTRPLHSHPGQGQLGRWGHWGHWGHWGRWGRWGRGQGRWLLKG